MSSKQLLIIAHAPSRNTRRLLARLIAGARHPDVAGVTVRALRAFETQPDDIIGAQAVVLMTPENLGYMSGALKDCFDRCYYPCLERSEAMPYAMLIRAGHDGTGTRRAIESITAGLRWRSVHAPVICRGQWRADFIDQATRLGAYLAAGLDLGMF